MNVTRLPDAPSIGPSGAYTNSAVEFGGGAAELPDGVSEGLRLLAGLFTARLESARQAGQSRADVDPTVAAACLLALYQAVLVLVRAGWDGQQVQALIDDILDRPEEPRHDN
jgi:TetR/AcrR family transcriptional repressor of nem operon